ncbi:MAG: leucine-rich repeat domain-containing protein [Paludibacteraceae bacterium]|nr:leucine-rich repeat domain-containing protein [Paludibacteraceae bacterium]
MTRHLTSIARFAMPLFMLIIGSTASFVHAASGTCGTNATWTLNETTGLLTISGSGAIADYSFLNSENPAPWRTDYSTIIKEVKINSGITKIGQYAFMDCKNLTKVTIPASVTTIAHGAFIYDSKLVTATIPSGVTTIGSSAFFSTGLTSVSIPATVTSIGSQAFQSCTSLKTVTFNTTKVTSIASQTFEGCSALTSINIPTSVTQIGSSAFIKCSSLSSITLPTALTTINSAAFRSCTALTAVTIPANVTTLGTYAFAECSALKTVTFNTTKITSIPDYAFQQCSALTSATIPSSVTSIGKYAFSYCGSLPTIVIPNSVTTMGEATFAYCTAATSLTLSTKLTAIPSSAFSHCKNIKTVTVPGSVTSIGINAFQFCDAMTSISLTNNITSIGGSAFYGCAQLASFTFPTQVTKIADNTFYGCGFTSITIPSTITSIGNMAFRDCKNMTSATIPSSVTSIGQEAFYGYYIQSQSKLKDIYVSWTTAAAIPAWGNGISWTNGVNLHIPCGTGAAYRAATGWKNFTIVGKTQYKLTVNTNNSAYGNVKIGSGTASGSVSQNTYCETQLQLTATPVTGYHFTKWSGGSTSTSNTITITMPGAATTYTANFAITNYTITVKTNNSNLGTVSGGGSVQEGKTTILTATSKNCTSGFVQWDDGNTDNPRTVTVTEDKTYTAQFVALSGNCGASGNNLTWSLDRCTGVLTISGSGAMADWASSADVPWSQWYTSIKSVVLPYELTSIGAYAFYQCPITSIDIPAAVKTIGRSAFTVSSLKELYIPEGITALPDYLLGSGYSATKAPVKRIYLPTTLKTIGAYSIAYNPLNVLTYPAAVTTVGSTPYRGAFPAKEVYASWTENVPARTGRIESVNSPKYKMHVPYGTKSLYTAKDWGRIYDLVEDFDERAIDLGLSIRWASCNVGATEPEENGTLFAWGDTLGRSAYTWANYPYSGTAANTLTRYNTRTASGTIDNRTTLIAFDDAAYINWGETWRMPTWTEWNELITRCAWEETTVNNVAVWKVTGPNGNFIYLPKAGYKANTSTTAGCYYWSSSLNTATSNDGCNRALYINAASRTGAKYGIRYVGMPVRAVYRREWPSFTLTITDNPAGTVTTKAINAGDSYTLTAQEDDCHRFVRWSDGNTNKVREVTVSANATYTAQFETITYSITVQADDAGKGDVTIEKQ